MTTSVCWRGQGVDWRNHSPTDSSSPQITDQRLHSQLFFLMSVPVSTGLFQNLATCSQSCLPNRHLHTSLLSQDFVLLEVLSIDCTDLERTRNKPPSTQSTASIFSMVLAVLLRRIAWWSPFWSFVHSKLLCQALIQRAPVTDD